VQWPTLWADQDLDTVELVGRLETQPVVRRFKKECLLTISLAVPRGEGGGGRLDLVPLEI